MLASRCSSNELSSKCWPQGVALMNVSSKYWPQEAALIMCLVGVGVKVQLK